jgi:hypothetical protein
MIMKVYNRKDSRSRRARLSKKCACRGACKVNLVGIRLANGCQNCSWWIDRARKGRGPSFGLISGEERPTGRQKSSCLFSFEETASKVPKRPRMSFTTQWTVRPGGRDTIRICSRVSRSKDDSSVCSRAPERNPRRFPSDKAATLQPLVGLLQTRSTKEAVRV